MERLANRAGRGKDKELQKISKHLAEDTVPDDKGGPATVPGTIRCPTYAQNIARADGRVTDSCDVVQTILHI